MTLMTTYEDQSETKIIQFPAQGPRGHSPDDPIAIPRAEPQAVAGQSPGEALTPEQRAVVESYAEQGRDGTIRIIRSALKARTGRAWSVTGGRGTAYGWITIDAPPARRTNHCRLKAGATMTRPEDYEMVNTGEPGGTMTDEDRATLAEAMGLESVHCQGENVPACRKYRRVAICRALYGHDGGYRAEAYWD